MDSIDTAALTAVAIADVEKSDSESSDEEEVKKAITAPEQICQCVKAKFKESCGVVQAKEAIEKENAQLVGLIQELDFQIMEYTRAVSEQLEQEQKAEASHQENVQRQELLLYHLKHKKAIREVEDADMTNDYDKLEAKYVIAQKELKYHILRKSHGIQNTG